MFNVPCRALWPAVSDTLKNSGKYWVQNIDNAAMSASYNVGGGPAKRTISVVLIAQGNSCELQTQAGAAPPGHHDAADFKDRVTLSLAKLQNARASAPARPAQGSSEKPPAGAALTNADVVKLKEAGLSEQVIIDKIKASPTQFHLDTDDMLQLRHAGLSDGIISAMIHASQRKE